MIKRNWSRRIIGLPAWIWIVLPIPLLVVADLMGTFCPAETIEEPADRTELTADPLLATPEGDGFRLLKFSESRGVEPLWAIGLQVQETSHVDWSVNAFIPSLYHMSSRWEYTLMANPFQRDRLKDKEHSFSLPSDTLARLRPQVVAELNRCDPAAKKGDRFEALLNDGLEATSYVCPQNAVVLSTWASMPLAVFALMRVLLDKKPATPEATASVP